MSTRTHVVIGILIDTEQRICLSLRPSHKHLGDLWEFPGGKLEINETPLAGLKREFFEELGVVIEAAEPFIQFPFDYPDRKVLLDFWLITKFSGVAHGREGQPIRWVTPASLQHYPLPEANQQVVTLILDKFKVG
jgi:8-oxo-dGTP diphosphatase